MGWYLSPWGTDEGFCAGVCDTQWGRETRLRDALSDQTHTHYRSGSHQWCVLILPCLTGNCLITDGWWVIGKEEKMDEAVKL